MEVNMAKKALCVGINNFKNFPSSALQGCVNDANDMAGVLKDFLGFKDADITKLTNATATKANIMKNLKLMVDGAKAGKYDYLVFSLSSHGTQVPDKNGDEPDNADEAFCPYDLAEKGDQWDPNHVITDDELHDLFITIPKNVLLEVYFDTCHSGTGLKAIDFMLTRKPRFLPPPSMKAFKQVADLEPRGMKNLMADKGTANHILWAGCRADQTSADAKIGSTWHGAFTYYFVKELRASKNKLARKDLLKKVKADLKENDYTQFPQLECDATRRSAKLA
jgi:metacaspase-1